jgi:hypothetical protein
MEFIMISSSEMWILLPEKGWINRGTLAILVGISQHESDLSRNSGH